MTPTCRRKPLKNYTEVRGAHMSSIRLLISEKQAGPCALEIDWVKASRAHHQAEREKK